MATLTAFRLFSLCGLSPAGEWGLLLVPEALVATAAGLFAAIPAVIAYNHFLHEIKDYAGRMNNFAAEFTAQLEKRYNS